jgi:hypothetical protein
MTVYLPSRVRIEGLEFVAIKDTLSHQVEIVKTTVDGQDIFLEMLRSMKVKDWGDFLPAKIYKHAGDLWTFKEEKFRGMAKLINQDGEFFVVLIEQNQLVKKVISVTDLPRTQKVKIGNQIKTLGGRPVLELFRNKAQIAKALDLDYETTKEEAEALRVMKTAQKAQQEAEREAREEARRKKLQAILSRPYVISHTEDGKTCYGTPATEEEWQILPHRHPVILVDSFDEETQTAEGIKEAFFVKKQGNKVSKVVPKKVSSEKPKKENLGNQIIEAKGILQTVIDGITTREILVFSKEDLAVLRQKNLNNNTLVALEQTDDQGRYTVLKLEGRECSTVGLFRPA